MRSLNSVRFGIRSPRFDLPDPRAIFVSGDTRMCRVVHVKSDLADPISMKLTWMSI